MGAMEPSAEEAPGPDTQAKKPGPLPAPEEPAPPLAAYPIERCAVDCRPSSRSASADCDTILKAEKLTPKEVAVAARTAA